MRDIHDFEPIWEGWEILEPKLGEGAYGSVWKARHTEANQLYFSAIKHISIPQNEAEINALKDEGILTDADSAHTYYQNLLQTLLAEIDVMYSLRGQTHIVSYEDHRVIPREDGIGYDVFIRMELLDKVHANRLTQADVMKLGKDIAAAIGLLNRLHIVHRDIKPQNILVNRIGDYKLGDYGTAKTLDRKLTSMSIKGTYSYMAPELFQSGKADATVDIYSLGIVLYRLLNGDRLPFYQPNETVTAKKTEEKLMRRISGEPLPPPALSSPGLSRVILKACAFRPEDRYQTGLELLRALEDLEKNDAQEEEDSISIFTRTKGRSSAHSETERPDAKQAAREAPESRKPGTGFGENTENLSEPTPEREAPSPRRRRAGRESAQETESRPNSGKAKGWGWRAIAALFLVILIALLALKPWERKDEEGVPSPSPTMETEKLETAAPEEVADRTAVPAADASESETVTPALATDAPASVTDDLSAETMPTTDASESATDTPAPVTDTPAPATDDLSAETTPAVDASESAPVMPAPATDDLSAETTPATDASDFATDTPAPVTDTPAPATDDLSAETAPAADASESAMVTSAPLPETEASEPEPDPATSATDTALPETETPAATAAVDASAPTDEPALFYVTGEPAAGDTVLSGIGVPGSEVSIRTKRVGKDWDDFRTVVVSVDGTWEADFSDQPLEGQEIIRIVYWITDTKTVFETITVSGEAPTPEPETAQGVDMAPVTPFYVPQSQAEFLKTIPELDLLGVSFTVSDTELLISAKSDLADIHVYDHDLELTGTKKELVQSTEAPDPVSLADHQEEGEPSLDQDLMLTAESRGTEYVYALGNHQYSDLTVTVADPGSKLLRKYTEISKTGESKSETQTQRFDRTCLLPGTDYTFYMGRDEGWRNCYYFSDSSRLKLIYLVYSGDDLRFAQTVYYTSAYDSSFHYAFDLELEDGHLQGSASFRQFDDTWYWDYKKEGWINADGTEIREDLTIRGDDPRYQLFLLPVATQEWFDALPAAVIEEENLSRPELTATDVIESMQATGEEEELREDSDLTHFQYTSYSSVVGGVVITGYTGTQTALIFPMEIHGQPVVQVGAGKPVGSSLKRVVIPEGITSIGEKAFQDSALEQISLPESLQRMGEYAFSGSHLQSVIVPAGVASVPAYCFYDCDRLEMVTLQEGLEYIEERSFVLCSSLRNVNIPASVKSLHSGAFARYTGKLVVNPDNPWLEQRGTCIFQKDTGVLLHCKVESNKAVIAEGVRVIGEHAFSAMGIGGNDVETVVFPSTLEEIGEFAFGYCMALSDLRIPGNVRKIGNAAFWNCNGLKEVVIEEGVEEIETDAFGCCYGLTRMILPASLKTIGSKAFTGSYEGDNTSITIVAPAGSEAAKYAIEGGYKYEEAAEKDTQ